MKFTLLRDIAEHKKRKYCYYNVFFYFFQGKKLHSGTIFFFKTINLCLHFIDKSQGEEIITIAFILKPVRKN